MISARPSFETKPDPRNTSKPGMDRNVGIAALLTPLTEAHAPLLRKYFAIGQPQVCEMSLTNIFCWSGRYPHFVGEINDHLLVGYRDIDGTLLVYQPLGGSPSRIIRELHPIITSETWISVEENTRVGLTGLYLESFDRDNSDYIYSTRSLQLLEGPEFSAKRKEIRRCARYHPIVEPISSSTISGCHNLLEYWFAEKIIPHSISLIAEYEATKVALNNFQRLGLSGICVIIDGKVEAFGIGEPLNAVTFVKHFGKANRELAGLYQFASHAFVRSIPTQYSYLNNEQDKGEPGLRAAKLGWRPIKMVNKFRLQKQA